MFRHPETGKWVANHLLKDCRKARKIYEAMQHIIAPTPAIQPAAQLTIQAPPPPAAAPPAHAAGAFQQQQQPQQEAPPPAQDAYPAPRGQLNMIQKGRPSNRA